MQGKLSEDSGSDSFHSIEIKGLTKSFGSRYALRGIDLNIREGESVTILGPNGAGKTTLLKIISTLSKASTGQLILAGLNLKKNAVEIRRKIGVVSHHTFLYDNLSAYENLKFYGKMYEVPDLEQRIKSVIDQVGLKTRLHDRVGIYSRGMQQRLSIARAILHDPSILLLDEPETGLDPQASNMLGELLSWLSSGSRTVLMTTHNLERGLERGSRVVILYRGKIVYQESCKKLDLTSLHKQYYDCTEVGN